MQKINGVILKYSTNKQYWSFMWKQSDLCFAWHEMFV